MGNTTATFIRNPYIRVAQRLLACGLFTRHDSLNVSSLFELHFLYSRLQGDRLDAGSSLVYQLHGATTSSAQRIVIGGIITPIARFIGMELNPNDRVASSERLNLATF